MTMDEHHARIEQFFRNAHLDFIKNGINVVILKGDDYSPERVPLVDAFFAAADINSDVPQVLWIHIRKHLAAISTYMRTGQLREPLHHRLVDVTNYMALIASYTTDPVQWLRHLDALIALRRFPDRTDTDVQHLVLWIHAQMVKHGALIEGRNPVLDTALSDDA